MYPVHEGLEWKSFTYPYLGEDTGIFDIQDPVIYDEYSDEGYIENGYGDIQGYGDLQPNGGFIEDYGNNGGVDIFLN